MSADCPFRLPIASLPVRGAWVEIANAERLVDIMASLPVRGAWVEITYRAASLTCHSRRSPCGERGLKWLTNGVLVNAFASLPVRGAWVEIFSLP